MALFREYDLRGVVGEELTEAIAEQVGRAYATMAREQGASRISLGRDGRLSSPGLQQALLRGLLAGGLDVVDLGLCASPLLYFSLFTLPVDGGIMITGSHNAAEYNGFKICIGKEAIHGEEIQRLRRVMEAGRFATGSGRLSLIPSFPTTCSISKRVFPACGRTISMS
jgi:phosphomannomutase/phosphoglucomutase